uniref:Uncharacterized protein n=1 Tax=uncultured marine group II/III euryarchaeote KM3_60_A11 TaxID=1456469 RepID=A0A075H9D4_9EURY|nr:hypothetical protein [uncultured marine group II/III euryarchaeote KM3_60_A11]
MEGKSNVARISVIALLIALLLGGGCVYYLWESGEAVQGVVIDGQFNDWAGIATSFDNPNDAGGNGNIDITETAVTIDKVYLSFLTSTQEPMFMSSQGTTLRILIDSDNNPSTGYSYPGIGADHLIEVYGEKNGMVSTSLLYVFDDSKDNSDWNGFYSLTTLQANATAADGVSNNLELQVPNFDLGIDAGSGLKFVIIMSDENGNSDSTNIIDLSRNEETFKNNLDQDRENANGQYTGTQILIDGSFDDWEQNVILKSDSDDDINSNIDIWRYANLTEETGDAFYYINVEGDILGGTIFADKSARNKATNSPAFDITLEEGESMAFDVPELSNEDQIFIFIDSDFNASTGYMGESIGADKLVQINGHYGVITSSTISNYVGLGSDWNWGAGTNTPAANDDNEIEVLGETGNYYFHILSWDSDIDDIKAEIYNKISLPDNRTAKDGSRAGTPSFPGSWHLVNNDADEGHNSDVEILSVHAAGDSEYAFFKITTEAAVDLSDTTIGIIIDDVSSNEGTYETACSSHRIGSTNYGFVYQWKFSAVWLDEAGEESDYTDHIVVNSGHNGIQIACDLDELGFTIDFENDKVRAVTTDADPNAFGDSSFWQGENVPSTSLDDITDATAIGIPEFSSLVMPIASLILIVGYNNRLKRKYSNQH